MSAQSAALNAALPLDPAGTHADMQDEPMELKTSGLNAAAWVPVRVLGPRHRRRILHHLLELETADRILRFGHPASDAQIERYVQSMDFFGRDELFGVFDRRLALVAMAHLALSLDEDSQAAPTAPPAPAAPGAAAAAAFSAGEFGVSVSPKARGRGLGGQLFAHTVTHARNRGAARLVIYLERSNTAMLAIVRKAGATITFDGSQAVATLSLERATLGTQMEALVEAQAAELDFQIKLQVQRLDRLWPRVLIKSWTSR